MATIYGSAGIEAGVHAVTTERALFPYKCIFIPRRARLKRVAYFTGEDFVRVRRIVATEAQLAYRLHFPLKATRYELRNETTLDVWRFEEKLWWPITEHQVASYPGEPMLARAFLSDLRGERDLFGLNTSNLGTWDVAATKEALDQAKEKDVTGYRPALAQLQRKVAEHILIIGDAACAAGGEPVYVQRKMYREAKETTIASLGSDRAVNQRLAGLRFPPGQCGDVNDALERGAFQFPNELKKAEAATNRFSPHPEEMPRIEVCVLHSALMTRDDVMVDALFRYALDGRRAWNNPCYVPKKIRIAADGLRQVAAADPGAATTTRDRFIALIHLADFIRTDDLGRYAEFRYLDRNLATVRASETLRHFGQGANELSDFEEKALLSLLSSFAGV